MFLDKHDRIVIGDYAYPIRNDYRVYIAVNRLLTNEEILEEDKAEQICRLVFIDEIPPVLQVKAIEAYLHLFITEKSTGEAVFDLEQDKELIYAGFMQSYGINLDMAEMSVEQFLALLKGLPETTRFAETIKIRTMPVPKATKYNAEERASIMKAKASVALKKKKDGAGLVSFGKMIKEWAENGR